MASWPICRTRGFGAAEDELAHRIGVRGAAREAQGGVGDCAGNVDRLDSGMDRGSSVPSGRVGLGPQPLLASKHLWLRMSVTAAGVHECRLLLLAQARVVTEEAGVTLLTASCRLHFDRPWLNC